MKETKETVGIDISKSTLDAHLHQKNLKARFENKEKGFIELLKWAREMTGLKDSELFFCFEHTGIYSMPLSAFLCSKDLQFAMVPALEIKKSLGMVRGKNDQIDAKRISEYGHLRRDQLKRTILPSVTLQKIKQLVTLRDRLVAQRAGYLASNKEFKGVFKKTDNPQLFVIHKKMIEDLSRHIAVVDQSIEDLIKSEPKLEEIYQLITSVKGIGPVIAAHLLVVTNCFEGFQKSRQLACYSGIAPFEKQSGISLKTRSRVSHYANKKMKTLLNLAATSAIQCDPELKAYYCRRIESGKSKMSTINIVRNKLLHRVFAVVKRKSPYVNIAKWAA